MKQPTITFLINGTTYRLCASDTEAIRNIPAIDRQHLVRLLEQVKYQESLSVAVNQPVVDKVEASSRSAANVPAAGIQAGHKELKPERPGSGDIDALMARLVLEDKHSRKPALTKGGIYKVIGICAVLVVFLVFIL
jgi:hypothetical protein